MNENPLIQQIQDLQTELNNLKGDYYANNFSGSQDFNKYSRFNTRIKIPHVSALPSVCEVGELTEYSGKAYICSSANTWTVIGTQV